MSVLRQDIEDLRHDVRRVEAYCRDLTLQMQELQRVVSRAMSEIGVYE